MLFSATFSKNMVRRMPIAQYHQRIVYPSIMKIVNKENSYFQVPKYSFCSNAPSEAQALFEKAKPLITDQVKSEINAVMVFCISGKNFLFDAHASRPLKLELVDEPPKDVDVTLTADEKTFMKLAKGEMKSTTAFMSGKLKIKGNIQLAMKAEKMFKVLQKESK